MGHGPKAHHGPKEGHVLRWGGLAGIVAVILAIIGRLILGSTPSIVDQAMSISTYVVQHRWQILLASLLYAIALAFFLWFGVALARAFRRGETSGDISAMVLAGFVFVTAIAFMAVTAFAGMAYAMSVHRLLLPIAAAPYAALTVMSTLGGIALAVPFVAAAVGIMRTRVFPVWMAWFAILVAVLAVLAAFAVGSTSGLFAPGSFLVGYLPWFLAGLWTLIAGGLLVREHLPMGTTQQARPVMGH
ncbi:hypothetical protein [Sinosporangium siamense]|uniref:hypothetical protein n=1 Tax=Sinosporangium siamense TaxID=1367973 RepID=UPI001EF30578|nr:hypothetical protein [Sinosporangium siamense]